MSHMRHDLADAASSKGSSPGRASKGGGDKPQTVKLVIAVSILVIAAGLILYQTGLFDAHPAPLAASPAAQADDNQNPDNPGEPPPKSGFSRKPQPIHPR